MLTFGLVELVKTEVRQRLNTLHSGIFLGWSFSQLFKKKTTNPATNLNTTNSACHTL
jgi:hypothetical protein